MESLSDDGEVMDGACSRSLRIAFARVMGSKKPVGLCLVHRVILSYFIIHEQLASPSFIVILVMRHCSPSLHLHTASKQYISLQMPSTHFLRFILA